MGQPILLDLPERLETPRLLIRPPQPGDGAVMNAAIKESFDELNLWMPWARELPTAEQSEVFAREAAARFARREELPLLLWERASNQLVGASGLHRIDWDVRSFEVGYWCRSSCVGRGYVAEAVRAIAEMAFNLLDARRFEARMDERNKRSWRVVEGLGFTFEGTLRSDSLSTSGELRNTRVYSIAALAELR